MDGYCGFDGWPACVSVDALAMTGGSVSDWLIGAGAVLAVIGLGVIAHHRAHGEDR